MSDLGIRHARPDEAGVFRLLWKEYLVEMLSHGGDVAASESNLDFFESLFTVYTTQSAKGIVLFADGKGVLMWGECPGGLETVRAPHAMAWGTYILPQHRRQGVARVLRQLALNRMREMGFRSLLGTIYTRNFAGHVSGVSFGFRPYGSSVCLEME